jgi:DNA-binding response OmpR family regulator
MSKILIIDDDIKLCEKLHKYLEGFNLNLEMIHHPLEGIKKIKDSSFDVLILDGMMPDLDGLETCKRIREFSEIPIIFLTGKVEESDKVLGLEYGADDYVTKPFSPRELVARIKSQLRRKNSKATPGVLQSSGIELNVGNYTASFNSKSVDFTATEFEILKFLLENKGVVKSREEIMEGLYGDTWEAFDRSLDIAISRVRKKLKNIDDKELIKTVRLKGYMFVNEN